MKQMIYCPKCKLDGRDKVIAELLPDGTVAIARQRSKWSYEESTLIQGQDFLLICGYCRTVVFIKKEVQNAEGNSVGSIWVHRITFVQGSVIQGIQSSQSNPGTPIFSN